MLTGVGWYILCSMSLEKILAVLEPCDSFCPTELVCLFYQELVVIHWNSPCRAETPLQHKWNFKGPGLE